MTEQLFLNEEGVSITQTRVTIGSTVYPVPGITAIRTATSPPRRGLAIFLGIVGFFFLLPGLAAQSGVAIILGLLLGGLAVYLWTQAKPTHHLMLGTAGAEKQALSSKDPVYINRISEAINQALVARG